MDFATCTISPFLSLYIFCLFCSFFFYCSLSFCLLYFALYFFSLGFKFPSNPQQSVLKMRTNIGGGVFESYWQNITTRRKYKAKKKYPALIWNAYTDITYLCVSLSAMRVELTVLFLYSTTGEVFFSHNRIVHQLLVRSFQ